MVYEDSSDFKPLYAIQIHSLNEALFYEFSELVKNGYRINRCKMCGKDMTFDVHYEWSQEAQGLRKEYTDVRDAISKNLNLSSKQKYSKKQKFGEKFIADIKAIPYPDKTGKRKSKGLLWFNFFDIKSALKIFVKSNRKRGVIGRKTP